MLSWRWYSLLLTFVTVQCLVCMHDLSSLAFSCVAALCPPIPMSLRNL